MSKEKIAITLEKESVGELDRLVSEQVFQNRSQAIQEAVSEKLKRMRHSRLARECAKMNPATQQTMSEEGFSEDMKNWPEY